MIKIRVYVECPFGKYGPDCRENCSGHCRGNITCNPVSGLCMEDCDPGERKLCASCMLIISSLQDANITFLKGQNYD